MAEAADMERILEEAFKSVRKGRVFRRVRVFTEWSKIVGETNARMARPVGYHGRTLLVKSDDAAWIDRLKYMEEEILKRIAEHLGDGHVTKIRFLIGEMRGAKESDAPEKDLTQPQKKKLAKLLQSREFEDKDSLKREFEVLLTNPLAKEKGRVRKRR
jgi:hypothetical protein